MIRGRTTGPVQNDNSAARDVAQETLEITVGRDEDEAVGCGVVEDSAVANAGKPVLKRTFGLRKEIADQQNQLRRKALVEEELHPAEILRSAANPAA